MQAAIPQTSLPGSARRKRKVPAWALVVVASVGLTLAAAFTAYAMRTRVADLGSEQQMNSSGLYAEWTKGAVIVLIRHAERCDRSENTCLGDPAGITVAGSEAAVEVGSAMQRLGLDNADVLASPEVRTQQTAHFLFGKAVAAQQWIKTCDHAFPGNLYDHKTPGTNLVLVTHSGCIDHLERQLNVPGGERSSQYASALFVSVGRNGKARILGQMNADQWHNVVSRASH